MKEGGTCAFEGGEKGFEKELKALDDASNDTI